MFKKLICMGVLLAMIFALFGCDGGLSKYKSFAKEELEVYAADKGRDNYCDENWAGITQFITDGKMEIGAAKNSVEVDSALVGAKAKIDTVEVEIQQPVKWNLTPPAEWKPSDEIQNGVYLMTDDSYENYRRILALHESPSLLGLSVPPPSRFMAIIYGNLISLDSGGGNNAVQFSRSGDFYIATQAYQAMLFTFSGDMLGVRLERLNGYNYNLQFKRDTSIPFAEEVPRQLAAPTNFHLATSHVRWNIVGEDFSSFNGARIECNYAGTESFTELAIGKTTADAKSINWRQLELVQGTNTLRVTLLGGLGIVDKKIHVTTDSEPATYEIAVTSVETVSRAKPTDFFIRKESDYIWLEWTQDDNGFLNKVYIKRSDQNFESFGYAVRNYVEIESLGLIQGKNAIRVVSIYDARFANGVLTKYIESQPAYVNLVMNANGKVTLQK